jgi:serine/threonine protein kinase
MKDLHSHGFVSIKLDDDMSNVCRLLPFAKDIPRIGQEQTILEEKWQFLDRSLWNSEGRDTLVGYNIGNFYREGTYGKIYKAKRMVVAKRPDDLYDIINSQHEIIVKVALPDKGTYLNNDEISSHTSESLLLVLSWRTMQESATPWGVPRPFEIFGARGSTKTGWTSMYLGMSYVRGKLLQSFLESNWTTASQKENTISFCHILAQVAYILYHLQAKLHLNHRDVKVNNILLRTGKGLTVLEIGESAITTKYEVVLIDFGFACIGCPPPKAPATVFQAGSWFTLQDMCCKKGRDIAQLLYCINCYFPLETYLTPEFFKLLSSWMQIPWACGIANALEGFRKDGVPNGGTPVYNTGIYEFLKRADVDPLACEPATIFAACCSSLNQLSNT